MSKTSVIKKDKTIQAMILGILIVLGLIWTNTFIHQNSFSEGLENFAFLKKSGVVVVYTLFYYWLMNCDQSGGPLRGTTRLCAVGTAVSGVLMLFALLLELGTDNFSLYGEKEIILWWFSVPKKYVYDFWTIIVFPTNIVTIFKAMRKEDFDVSALFYGIIAILGLTLEGCLIFWPMNNIWLVDLMVLNTITVALAVWKYAVPEKRIRKGNAIAAIILYGVMRMVFLPLMCVSGNGNFSSFMYAGDWSDLISGISELVKNAALFGTSDYLLKSEYIHIWLADRNKPILQLLYYGGWASVIGLIVFLIGFMIVIVKLLGVKNGREHRNWLVFGTAVTMFSIRAIMGLLYSFGFPYPVALPFLGTNGSIMDAMAFALILIGAWENHKINQFLQIDSTFVSPNDVLGIQDEYYIVDDWGEPYTEEIYDDEVDIIGNEVTVRCKAEWYTVDERAFCVFEKKNIETGIQRFIFEYTNENWKVLTNDDNDLMERVIEEYKCNNKPDCMLEERHINDEEYFFAD